MLHCFSTLFMIANRMGERGPMKVRIQAQEEELKVECFVLESKKLPEA